MSLRRSSRKPVPRIPIGLGLELPLSGAGRKRGRSLSTATSRKNEREEEQDSLEATVVEEDEEEQPQEHQSLRRRSPLVGMLNVEQLDPDVPNPFQSPSPRRKRSKPTSPVSLPESDGDWDPAPVHRLTAQRQRGGGKRGRGRASARQPLRKRGAASSEAAARRNTTTTTTTINNNNNAVSSSSGSSSTSGTTSSDGGGTSSSSDGEDDNFFERRHQPAAATRGARRRTAGASRKRGAPKASRQNTAGFQQQQEKQQRRTGKPRPPSTVSRIFGRHFVCEVEPDVASLSGEEAFHSGDEGFGADGDRRPRSDEDAELSPAQEGEVSPPGSPGVVKVMRMPRVRRDPWSEEKTPIMYDPAQHQPLVGERVPSYEEMCFHLKLLRRGNQTEEPEQGGANGRPEKTHLQNVFSDSFLARGGGASAAHQQHPEQEGHEDEGGGGGGGGDRSNGDHQNQADSLEEQAQEATPMPVPDDVPAARKTTKQVRQLDSGLVAMLRGRLPYDRNTCAKRLSQSTAAAPETQQQQAAPSHSKRDGDAEEEGEEERVRIAEASAPLGLGGGFQ